MSTLMDLICLARRNSKLLSEIRHPVKDILSTEKHRPEKKIFYRYQTYPKPDSGVDNEKASVSHKSSCGQERESSRIRPVVTDQLPDVDGSAYDLELENLNMSNLESKPIIKIAVSVSGLENLGDTCYISSVIQVLRYTPNFLEYLHHFVWEFTERKMENVQGVLGLVSESPHLQCLSQLHALYTTMGIRERVILFEKGIRMPLDHSWPLRRFVARLREASLKFEKYSQHDSHEFLLELLTVLPDESHCVFFPSRICDQSSKSPAVASKKEHEDGKKTEDDVPIRIINVTFETKELLRSMFDGCLLQTVECLECKNKQEMQEAFFDLQVPLAAMDNDDVSENISLVDCLMKESFLHGDNKRFCPACLRYAEAKLSEIITKSPSVLILHLSWLSELSVLTAETKSRPRITVPLVLESSDEFTKFTEANVKYSLYAAVMHLGSSSTSGHYVAFIKISRNHAANELVPAKSTASRGFHQEKLLKDNDNCCSLNYLWKLKNDTCGQKKDACGPKKDTCGLKKDTCKLEKDTCKLEKDTCVKTYSWHLFDDENVVVLDVDDDSETLPYEKYLGLTATPLMLFYQRL